MSIIIKQKLIGMTNIALLNISSANGISSSSLSLFDAGRGIASALAVIPDSLMSLHFSSSGMVKPWGEASKHNQANEVIDSTKTDWLRRHTDVVRSFLGFGLHRVTTVGRKVRKVKVARKFTRSRLAKNNHACHAISTLCLSRVWIGWL